MQNGRWSVDIVLRASYVQVIFRHTSFAEKQGDMCWHQILARSRTYLTWPQMEKWSSWKSSVLSIWTSLKFGSSQSDFISKAETMLKVLRSYIQSTVWLIKPPIQAQIKKSSTWIVFVSSKRSIFYILISIRDRMKKLEPFECSPARRLRMARPTRHDVWWVAPPLGCLARAIRPRILPWIEKRPTWKLFVSSKWSRLLLDSFPSEVVYHHKKDPQGAASLNRTVLESSDKTNPNLTRVLNVNPSLFLAREVSRLLYT